MSSERKDPVEDTPKKIILQWIRGIPFPTHIFTSSNLEKVIDFKPQDTDIFVVTYPKCGTTWTQFIVWEILHSGAVPPSPNQMLFLHFPFLEATGTDMLNELAPPRPMKTHMPFSLNPYNPKAKYIYVVRNPWDCCVSYYYHTILTPGFSKMKWEDFVDCFILGEIGWGDFFDHVLSWFDHKNDPNVLFLTYEEMKKDKIKTILDIASFLGGEYYNSVRNEDVLQNCLKHSDFQYMKKLGMFFPKRPKEKTQGCNPDFKPEMFRKHVGEISRHNVNKDAFEEVNFFRKGEVGDWKNHFTSEQIEKFNAYMLRKLRNTKMENFWKAEA